MPPSSRGPGTWPPGYGFRDGSFASFATKRAWRSRRQRTQRTLLLAPTSLMSELSLPKSTIGPDTAVSSTMESNSLTIGSRRARFQLSAVGLSLIAWSEAENPRTIASRCMRAALNANGLQRPAQGDFCVDERRDSASMNLPRHLPTRLGSRSCPRLPTSHSFRRTAEKVTKYFLGKRIRFAVWTIEVFDLMRLLKIERGASVQLASLIPVTGSLVRRGSRNCSRVTPV